MNDDYEARAIDLLDKAETAMEGTEWGEDHYFRAQAFALIAIGESLLNLTRHIIDKEGK
jgi:hypothetical protein